MIKRYDILPRRKRTGEEPEPDGPEE